MMCGRFTITLQKKELREYVYEKYQIPTMRDDIQLPRYNVAPGQQVISVLNDGTAYRIGLLQWGFVPFFAKDEKIGFNMINAKSETLIEKPSFKPSFLNKRCIILADGFYEWKREDGTKVPYRFTLTPESLFPMAGLWSSFTRLDGTKLFTCTIITTKANTLMAPIHDRMPVILTDETVSTWLNPQVNDLSYLSNLLTPYDSSKMSFYRVPTIVGNAKNDSPECISRI